MRYKSKIFIKAFNIEKLFFVIFLIVCIIDPSNRVFGLKEFFLSAFVFVSLRSFLTKINAEILFFSLLFGFAIPIFYVTLGYYVDSHFSLPVALDYLKVFALLFLINFLLLSKSVYLRLFSLTTLILVPVTWIIYGFLYFGYFEYLESILGDYTNTVMIANREFGTTSMMMVYHKTIALLFFGFAFLLSKKNISLLGWIFVVLVLNTLILSATRAIFLASFLIILFMLHDKLFSKTGNRRLLFASFVGLAVISISPFVLDVFLDVNEGSNSTKIGFVFDYLELWKESPGLFLIGHGLGSGMVTVERGLIYNVETTYFELIRMFGVVGFLGSFLILLLPVWYFWERNLINKVGSEVKYFIVSYVIYIFVIIPSNPLLLSSTGMLVVCIAYSTMFSDNLKFFSIESSNPSGNIQ